MFDDGEISSVLEHTEVENNTLTAASTTEPVGQQTKLLVFKNDRNAKRLSFVARREHI